MAGPFAPFDQHGGGGPRIREIPLRLMVPNIITVLAVCAGLTGIRLAFENEVETAVIMVLIAAFLDAVDGRVARAFKATSKFGAEMDSLADIVNFGAAPALVLYAYILDKAGAIGWIAALLFAIACVLRLARFNVMLEDGGRPAWQADYFVGVPAPAGAALVMLPIYLGFLGFTPDRGVAFAACAYTVIVAFLMVSRLPVYSGKSSGSRVRRELVMPLMLGVVFYVLLLVSYPWQTMTVSAFAYMVFLVFSVRAYSCRAQKEDAATEDGAGSL
ncbi:CDP-diacylglycerol--serine O-phosphatidyltransferase [Chelativorans sp. Marseille-P2723]|uniref:CDP-diacylglycerol--serine O-phosphatidyltransferase n=1 Tax=Chelativorans sp. Marseille-P2723 TaxID=2709133 RepID=UPI00156DEB22|nr:CDP-diacylglycerol--serine O-phosphatidyltransferase [Chelativorans sp. Marseille-P2723]